MTTGIIQSYLLLLLYPYPCFSATRYTWLSALLIGVAGYKLLCQWRLSYHFRLMPQMRDVRKQSVRTNYAYRPQHAVEPKMLEVPEGFRSKQPRVVRYSQQPHMGVRP